MKKLIIAALAALVFALPAQAHHSFAVHFVGDHLVEVTGTVKEFRFTNPHGVLTFTAVNDSGEEVEWRAETNSPNVLRRRGWSADSLQPGDKITILGFPAREEQYYMRISEVTKADGTTLTAQAKAD